MGAKVARQSPGIPQGAPLQVEQTSDLLLQRLRKSGQSQSDPAAMQVAYTDAAVLNDLCQACTAVHAAQSSHFAASTQSASARFKAPAARLLYPGAAQLNTGS